VSDLPEAGEGNTERQGCFEARMQGLEQMWLASSMDGGYLLHLIVVTECLFRVSLSHIHSSSTHQPEARQRLHLSPDTFSNSLHYGASAFTRSPCRFSNFNPIGDRNGCTIMDLSHAEPDHYMCHYYCRLHSIPHSSNAI
jgi:hypothetical protein